MSGVVVAGGRLAILGAFFEFLEEFMQFVTGESLEDLSFRTISNLEVLLVGSMFRMDFPQIGDESTNGGDLLFDRSGFIFLFLQVTDELPERYWRERLAR